MRRRRRAQPDALVVLRVHAYHRRTPAGRVVTLVAPDLAPRELHACDADELDYLLQYELDVIMSETGRDVHLTQSFGHDCAPLQSEPIRRGRCE